MALSASLRAMLLAVPALVGCQAIGSFKDFSYSSGKRRWR